MAERNLDEDARRVFRVGAWWSYVLAGLIGVEGVIYSVVFEWGARANMLALADLIWVVGTIVFLVLGVLLGRKIWWAAPVGLLIAAVFGVMAVDCFVEDFGSLGGPDWVALLDAAAAWILVYRLVRCVRVPRKRLRMAGVRGFEVVGTKERKR